MTTNTDGFSMQEMTSPVGTIFELQSKSEQDIVLDCLKIIAYKGSYEAGSVEAFNDIAKKYNINVSYTELADLMWDLHG